MHLVAKNKKLLQEMKKLFILNYGIMEDCFL